ncbi:pyridoxamine kinase [Erysipelatoclostridium sp. AM42-17]|uniref:pyridoxamine kinase n=1 Tax=Erysipelatoclostridium sp. AM42-17 TaxID=2293102 RepID=UPI000E4CFC84|nr:pyridoxamine kinase [Erysipelatoclostridium sp. AM42-17]RHS91372.1 pyridoxamine kinase [Erysipelatoclostridium sp. AM42-17]
MRQKRIVLINDVTGYSRCSVACQLPIISSMGIETVFVPTAILSINTYHPDFFFDDYTDKMTAYIQTYKTMNVEFDGICSGFLGSVKQIDIVKDFFKSFKTDQNFILVDPVMGDHGHLYPTYTKQMQEKMRDLMPYATIVTPNLTELCALIDEEYHETYDDQELFRMCQKLSKMGPQLIVVTGISHGQKILNFVYDHGQYYRVEVDRIGEDRSGTGDVYSAIIAGRYLQGCSFLQCIKQAAAFASKCIAYSKSIEAHPHLGLCFEPFLKELGD